ncbi:glycosyltransferase [Cellulomonas soli]|uniref:glycosyltransferase n=1 Tax=Cellulomonas soli TaxID=931535 RepID=UPI003F85C101
MRILVVSAHYPPNHTSGGTLVPQRLARGLAARGHEVSVYAGHLGDEREPLSTWDERDETGLPIHWISITPFTSWSDPLNSLNPAVEDEFRAWLREHPVDVVHLHSLQTFGAGLVSIAAESGARVVVTMHDFWWSCARQFLVAPDRRPCSLVVACGGCPCAVDHEWLRARNRALGTHLARADVVLAPSRTAADVMIANGVPAGRMRVDENGIPTPQAVDHVSPADGAIRLVFAGGRDPMKGLPVLREALAEVPPGAWSIDLFGVTPEDVEGLGSHVRARERYRPDELAGVLAEHDVLVLASVMRESHSILTREALMAGLAVVCTDTLGPEEVVVDGANGLVVPAGDAHALAVAIRSLVTDPARVATLQEHAPDVRVRTLDEQVASTEALFVELLAEPADVASAVEPLVRRVLFIVGIPGAPLRYRAQLPAEALAEMGIVSEVRHYRDPELPALAAFADAVVLYRVPATDQVLELVGSIRSRERRVPILFDVDDLIVDPELRGQVHGLEGMAEAELDLWWRGVARYRTTLEAADAYIGSTDALCEQVGALTGLPTYRYANGVGTTMGQLAEHALGRPRSPGPLRIGYFSGTTTHDADWALIEPAVVEILRRYPEIELWLGGHLRTGDDLTPFEHRVRRLPMLAWTDLPGRLRDLDVNLAPLVLGSVFNEAKSAIKWLEAALVATPTVASPTQPFAEAIEHGQTGLLAATSQEWVEALDMLIGDEHQRALIGARAQRSALLRYSPARQGERYRAILLDAARRVAEGGEARVSTWSPVSDDEPYTAAAAHWVEAYPPPAGRPAAAWRRYVAVVRHTYSDGGVRAVVAGVRRRVRRG